MRAPEHAVKIKKRAAKSCSNPAESMTAQWFTSRKTRAVKTLQIVTSTWKNRYENPYQQRVYAFSPRAGKYSKNRPSVQDAGGVPSWSGGRASRAGPYVDPGVQVPSPRLWIRCDRQIVAAGLVPDWRGKVCPTGLERQIATGWRASQAHDVNVASRQPIRGLGRCSVRRAGGYGQAKLEHARSVLPRARAWRPSRRPNTRPSFDARL
jgi:hypothetical protein